ncbi:hypothetical protein [Ehrlichia muris]|uniref:Uncharacterized protein n=1 Tax=Ehrlichia muris AS145 TaxID=1423892 RepID=V9RAE4_9RICK|nr:hypothetical protein [Ehrlichia muris]AHC39759.1 hypothetical protein EMUR_04010 [Ehrlichia muris AS145]
MKRLDLVGSVENPSALDRRMSLGMKSLLDIKFIMISVSENGVSILKI